MVGPPIRRTVPLVAAVLLLLCVAIGTASLPRLRNERLALVRLQNHIERAAGPDEPLLIDDRWLGLAMRWVGSRAATRTMTLVGDEGRVDAVFAGREVVLAAHPGDGLLRSLQAAGYKVIPDAEEASWDGTGDGSELCGHAGVRIYFVLPPAARTTNAEIPSNS